MPGLAEDLPGAAAEGEGRAVLSASYRHIPLLPDSYRCP